MKLINLGLFVLLSVGSSISATASGKRDATEEGISLSKIAKTFMLANVEFQSVGGGDNGYPADVKLQTKAAILKMLADFKSDDFDPTKMQLEKISFGNVSGKDPDDVILLSGDDRSGQWHLICLKNGEVHVLEIGKTVGTTPPRIPAFIDK